MVTAHPDRHTHRQTHDGLKAYGLSHLDKPVRMRIKKRVQGDRREDWGGGRREWGRRKERGWERMGRGREGRREGRREEGWRREGGKRGGEEVMGMYGVICMYGFAM